MRLLEHRYPNGQIRIYYTGSGVRSCRRGLTFRLSFVKKRLLANTWIGFGYE